MMTNKIPAEVLYGMIGGRWQPFHKGHLWLLKHACNKYEKVIVGIVDIDPMNPPVSPNEWPWFHPAVNPFTFWERLAMLHDVCIEAGVFEQIAGVIPWGHALKFGWEEENYLLPPPNRRVLLLPLVRDEEQQRLSRLREITNVDAVTDFPDEILVYSASKIRSAMYHDQPWEQYVPEAIVDLIKRIDGIRRVKRLYEHYGLDNIPYRTP